MKTPKARHDARTADLQRRAKTQTLRLLNVSPISVFRYLRGRTPAELKSSPVARPLRAVIRKLRRQLKPAPTAIKPKFDARIPIDDAQDFRDASHAKNRLPVVSHPIPKGARVAALILNRDGEANLRELFQSLAVFELETRLEIWLIDHASQDDSVLVAKSYQDRLDIHIVEYPVNRRYSVSNNDLASRTDADYILLLNNDIILTQPIVYQMMAHLQDQAIGAVGIPLYYPERHAVYPGELQHAGVKYFYDISSQGFRPYNLNVQHGVTRVGFGVERMPAVTAACLMMRRVDYLEIGGLEEAYDYGMEDVDLCMKVRSLLRKEVVLDHDLSAIHDESSSQNRDARESVRQRRLQNFSFFQERWGFSLRSAFFRDRYANGYFFSDQPLRVGLLVTETGDNAQAGDTFTATELAEALQALTGCQYTLLSRRDNEWQQLEYFDLVISMLDAFKLDQMKTDPLGLLCIAWVRQGFEKWGLDNKLSQYSLIFTVSEAARHYIEEKSGFSSEILPIATNPDRFAHGQKREKHLSDVCFTGSRWGQVRQIEGSFHPRRLDGTFAVYGANWEKNTVFSKYTRGFLPYLEIPDVYASTKIVIDDTIVQNNGWGSVNSRVFDALGAGRLVVSNSLGAKELFGDSLPYYDATTDVTSMLNEYLRDDARRNQLASDLQKVVLNKHCYAHRAQRFMEVLGGVMATRFRIGIKVAAPRGNPRGWGDYHFALALVRAFAKLGHHARIDFSGEGNRLQALGDDVALVLRGRERYKPAPHQINLMWNISHPTEVTAEEYCEYDHVFVSSTIYAERLSFLNVPLEVLHQATDPAIFAPQARTNVDEADHEVLFVGNSRRQRRKIVLDAIEARLPLSVYGSYWEGLIPAEYIKADHIENTELSQHYQYAETVLNDHWPAMAEQGFLSNRLFDAAAVEAKIISDEVPGLHDIFGDVVKTYREASELPKLVQAFKDETPSEARARSELGATIRRDHNFDVRAKAILEVVQAIAAKRATVPLVDALR